MDYKELNKNMSWLNSPPIPPAKAGQALSLKAFCPAASARRKRGKKRIWCTYEVVKGGEFVASVNILKLIHRILVIIQSSDILHILGQGRIV